MESAWSVSSFISFCLFSILRPDLILKRILHALTFRLIFPDEIRLKLPVKKGIYFDIRLQVMKAH